MGGRLLEDAGRHESFWLGGLSGAVIIAALAIVEPRFVELRSLVLTVFFGTWVLTAFVMRTILRHVRQDRARPRRWRRPRPSPHASQLHAAQGVVAGEPVLHAPMSHTPCLGWVVQMYNDEGLILDEQRHAELEIDGQVLAADSIALELGLQELPVKPRDEGVERFMRRRGLSPHDASLRVYVALLVLGMPVALEPRPAERGGAILRSVASLAISSPSVRAA